MAGVEVRDVGHAGKYISCSSWHSSLYLVENAREHVDNNYLTICFFGKLLQRSS